MSYYESAEGITISKERAKKEIAKHGSKTLKLYWLGWDTK